MTGACVTFSLLESNMIYELEIRGHPIETLSKSQRSDQRYSMVRARAYSNSD
jgi:hypothetical protein